MLKSIATASAAVNCEPLGDFSVPIARGGGHRVRVLKVHRALYEAVAERGRLPPAAQKLLQALIRWADPRGVSWPRLRRLVQQITRSAKHAFYKLDTLRKAVRFLRSEGLLVWDRVLPNGKFPSGMGTACGGRTWIVQLEAVAKRVGFRPRPVVSEEGQAPEERPTAAAAVRAAPEETPDAPAEIVSDVLPSSIGVDQGVELASRFPGSLLAAVFGKRPKPS